MPALPPVFWKHQAPVVESASHSWIYSGVCSASDLRGRWFTKKGRQPRRPLLPVLEGAIDLIFSLFDGHRPTDRGHTGFVLAIAKPDRPSPNPVFRQLNDGVFYSLVFHDMRPPVSERDIRQNDDPVCPLVNLTIPQALDVSSPPPSWPGQKREARLRARCPGHPRLCLLRRC